MAEVRRKVRPSGSSNAGDRILHERTHAAEHVVQLTQLSTALAGRYLVERELGRGGMATVYLARDVRHERPVALKVLHAELGVLLGPERFLAEIRVTANLQHPNLLPLFDSGEADGRLFYTMPFIDGESLRQRLDRERQLPVAEAVRIAIAVAGALDYAHRKGVVHRDLKPENILLADGQPLVADFGIALAVAKAAGDRITQSGLSLGTPPYMSPEQGAGDLQLDGRTDVYSLGCVLYEMLAGEPPFTGVSGQAVIARLMTEVPRPISQLRHTVPPSVDNALARALEKLPADRWPTARDFATALTTPTLNAPSLTASSATRTASAFAGDERTPWYSRLAQPIVVAALAVAVATGATTRWLLEPRVPALQLMRLSLALPRGDRVLDNQAATPIAISRDGQLIAYVGTSGNGSQLFLRRISELQPRAINGTSSAAFPTFSPDGKWIAFVVPLKQVIMKVRLDGGSPETVANVGRNIGGLTWQTNETLVTSFINSDRRIVLWRVPAAGGGRPTPITTPAANDSDLAQLLPQAGGDDNTILYVSARGGSLNDFVLAAASLTTGSKALLGVPRAFPLGTVEGHVVYVDGDGNVMAAAFDTRHLRMTGAPVPVETGVRRLGRGNAVAALSSTGTLVYADQATAGSRLVLTDERGASRALADQTRLYGHPRFSPDGRRVAVEIGRDIWVLELASGILARVTTAEINAVPEWMPDGRRLVFRSNRAGGRAVFNIWWQPIDGSGPAEELYAVKGGTGDGVVAPDGRSLVFTDLDPKTGPDIWMLPLAGERTSRPLVATEFNEGSPRVSPDGHWLAYVSDESGRPELYVRPFPDGKARVQVSTDGASEPLWSPDGRRLFYRQERKLIAASVAPSSGGSWGSTAAPVRRDVLFEGDFERSGSTDYDVSRDGTHFLMLQPTSEPQLVVVVNALSELGDRAAQVRR